MKIATAEILSSESLELNETFTPDELGVAGTAVSPILVKMKISHGDNGSIIVEGIVHTTIKMTCVSCLEDFEEDFDFEFSEVYVEEKRATATEGEADFSELSVFTYKGDFLDTKEIVKNTFESSVPVYPKCNKCR